MGNKINPLGFRLGFTQNHYSLWFEERDYSEDLREDERIYNCIENYVKHIKSSINSSYGGITRIEILKQTELISVNIYIAFVDLFIEKKAPRKKEKMKELRKEVQKMLVQSMLNSVNRELVISIEKVDTPYREPKILAEYIALQLKERVEIRKIMKKAIQLAEKATVEGVKIKIKGRLNGIERARKESAMKGRVPLQTLRAKIDYCYYAVQTVYGVLGIKIWIFV
jgi:small subunit ribosomal protein S3|uniref:Small ribosomal subunit protein uS3c n=6 Tax=Cupressaceae TaxID=3367 RepID=A0A0U2JWD1_9CONI|nr:ribosomal protein S3 [Cupressus sempervirens]YP_009175398.1 ribosomal protein S3 [Cupressus gigantea]YP_009370377.1 ribosomal protein S3 [Cupressus chengiana]YP_009520530.1 ribosomal protein S3 [Cupressus tonkinensis]YP_009520612.1 ribosomal protein S3 [Cupressus torulosa]YP_009917331.1 ribosomal protein S3 [Callitropsis funebris]YP_010426693.1 ribosomal protein S3 [Cupressus duclouxiana]AJE70957.1 ribosomal protein S3 [Cupressus sempervirens]ALG65389.1 ribosomal protein S3 [Cupressus gi